MTKQVRYILCGLFLASWLAICVATLRQEPYCAEAQSGSFAWQNSVSGTMGVTDAAVTLPLDGRAAAAAILTGTWAGTVTPQVSINGGTTYANSLFYNVATQAVSSTVTANGSYLILNVAGASHVRIILSPYTSGTATAVLRVAIGQFGGRLDVNIAALGMGALDVTEVNSAAIAASLGVLDDWDESDRAKINPIVGQAGVAAGAGASGANTVRVVTASDSTVTEANSAAIKTAVEVMDDWDETNRAAVNPIAGQAGVAAGAGASGASTIRVVTAADSTITVTQAGSVNIGTFPDNEPFNLAQIAGATVPTGTGASAGALRVAISADSTGTPDTELAAAAAAADAAANPTAGGVLAYLLGYNGTTWDRLRLDGSKNLLVSLGTRLDAANDTIDVSRIAGVVPLMSGGKLQVDGTIVAALPAGAAHIGGVDATIQGTVTVAGTVSLGVAADVTVVAQRGAASFATGQVNLGATEGLILAARPGRRRLVVLNLDAANSCWIGGSGGTSANGFRLAFGESISLNATGAVSGIRATSDVSVSYLEEWN